MGRDTRGLSGVMGHSVSYRGWNHMGACICQNSLYGVLKICVFH